MQRLDPGFLAIDILFCTYRIYRLFSNNAKTLAIDLRGYPRSKIRYTLWEGTVWSPERHCVRSRRARPALWKPEGNEPGFSLPVDSSEWMFFGRFFHESEWLEFSYHLPGDCHLGCFSEGSVHNEKWTSSYLWEKIPVIESDKHAHRWKIIIWVFSGVIDGDLEQPQSAVEHTKNRFSPLPKQTFY